ncbi:hypothetical protein HK405_015617, partial [Cladochytrium tenue]
MPPPPTTAIGSAAGMPTTAGPAAPTFASATVVVRLEGRCLGTAARLAASARAVAAAAQQPPPLQPPAKAPGPPAVIVVLDSVRFPGGPSTVD